MEITIDTLINLAGFFLGTGGGAFFTWRYMRRKAAAEAEQAEVEVKEKEVEVAMKQQDYYQQLAKDLAEDREDRKRQNDELRAERDHYKNERNELQERIDKLTRSMMEWKRTTDETIDDLKRKVARNGRQINTMRPLMCGEMKCKKRVLVQVSDTEALENTIRPEGKKDIEPYDDRPDA